MMRFQDKTAIITGAASGIGAASMKRLIAEGATVICADINDSLGEQLTAELGEKAIYHHCDVGQLEELEAVVAFAEKELGGLDIMMNNAMYSTGGPIHDIDPDEWNKSINIMLNAVFYGTRAALPAMIKRGGGSVINTASIEAFGGEMFASPYTTAKAGVVNFTKNTAIEYARLGIRANAICPGIVETPLFARMDAGATNNREQMENLSPMGRLIQPEEIAAVVAFLASEDASAITGEAVVVDAGTTAMLNLGGTPPIGAT